MSAFYVGQRVRYVRAGSKRSTRFVGGETTIIAIGCRFGDVVFGGFNIRDADCLLGFKFPNGGHLLADFGQIEPILPPGLESLEEINALYEPSPVEVRA